MSGEIRIISGFLILDFVKIVQMTKEAHETTKETAETTKAEPQATKVAYETTKAITQTTKVSILPPPKLQLPK
jgi:hypothetical protein